MQGQLEKSTTIKGLQQFKQLFDSKSTVLDQVELLQDIQKIPLSSDLLVNAVQFLHQSMLAIPLTTPQTIDIVGTGGDGQNTFNISTAASFVIAATGHSVAKHGNQAVTSQAGSFDVLKALEIDIPCDVVKAYQRLKHSGLTFLFAPYFHPLLKAIMPARKILSEKKQKTIFNVLGPLLNPCKVKRICIGVYSKELIKPMIEALLKLNYEKAIVYHGAGLDEFTLTGTTDYALLNEGQITYHQINPRDYGFTLCDLNELKGGGSEENAEIIKGIFQGKIEGAKKDIVILNAGFGIMIANDKMTLSETFEKARYSIEAGNTNRFLIKHQGHGL